MNAVSKFAGVLAVAFVAACGGGQESKNPPERKLTSEEQKAVAAVVASAERDQALYSKGLAAPARTESARAQDAHRKPQDLLNLLRVQPGMAIADASGSDSYMSDILAGLEPSGVKVIRVGKDASGLAALQPGSVDTVLSYLAYHELVADEADRAAWLAAAKQVLRPDGALLVVDYAADPDSGSRDAKDLGRIDERLVQQEAEMAGFRVEEVNSMFRNATDDRGVASSAVEPPGSADQFAMRFRKLSE